MTTGWNSIPSAQQALFLQAAGLSQLPDLSAISESHRKILSGIIGGEQAARLNEPPQEDSIASPTLPPSPPTVSGDWTDIMTRVAELRAKLGNLQVKTASSGVEIEKDRLDELEKAEQKRFQDIIKNLEGAKKSGTAKKIFGWIGAAVAVLGGAVLTVATLGMGAPIVLAGLGMMAMMAIEETGNMDAFLETAVRHTPIISTLVENGTIDIEDAKRGIQIGISLALAAVQVATSLLIAAGTIAVGVILVATGAGSPAGAAAIAIAVAMVAASLAGAAASAGSGAAQVGGAISSGIQGGYVKEAEYLQADSVENKAWIANIQAALGEQMDKFEELLRKLHEGVANISELLGGTADTQHAIMSNISS